MNKVTTPITAEAAFRQLGQAGYPRNYIKKFLPEWWDNSLIRTSAGSLQFALILRQRLGLRVEFNPDGTIAIASVAPAARFKHRVDTEESELTVAANLGLALAKTSMFSLKPPYRALPTDPIAVREQCLSLSKDNTVSFQSLLDLCWNHGIPVLFLNYLPRGSKRVTGMAISITDRPAIILGFNHKQSARQLFVLAHELGHVLLGHIGSDSVLLDEELAEVQGNLEGSPEVPKDQQELEADTFALKLIRGPIDDPLEEIGSQKSAAELLAATIPVAKKYGIDPGHLILSYAKSHDEWVLANQALNFLPREINPLELLANRFKENSNLGSLSEEHADYVLLTQGYDR